MAALSVLSIIFGISIVFGTLNDVFQSVVVPRAVGRRYRYSSYLWRGTWRLWPILAWRVHPENERKREDFLAAFAPVTLIVMIAMWGAFLALGYGSIVWGLRDHMSPHNESYGSSIYFAATSILTLGFGDIVPEGPWVRFLAVCAGASGLCVVSITTAFLFALFGAFQQREAFVLRLGARAGSPPSGVGLLAIAGYADLCDDLENVMKEAQMWVATLMETHLAYPVLAFFRSSHNDESWIGALGTLLDASVLMMTTIEGRAGQARILYNIGRHATADLCRYFSLAGSSRTPGVEREEFDRACDRILAAGFTLKNRDEAWKHFSDLRGAYAGELNALSRLFIIPPLQWVGDRSLLMPPLPHAYAQKP
jgi:Ion channel